MTKIKYKILVIFIVTSSFFILLSGAYNIYNLNTLNNSQVENVRQLLMEDYNSMVKNEVETAISVIETYYTFYQEGVLTETEAKDYAKTTVKKLNYGGDGYFWIDNTNGIMEAHPFIPEQEGNNRMDLADSNGVRIVEGLIRAAVDNADGGYTSTGWEKPEDVGTGILTTQIIYSKLFPEWNWVISTGHFIDDINAKIEDTRVALSDNLQKNIIAVITFILTAIVFVWIISLATSKRISDPINKLVKAFEKDSNGQISIQKIQIKSRDEIGVLGNTLNELSLQIHNFIEGVIQEANNVTESANKVEEGMKQLYDQMQEISATTEQLSAGTEETAASAEEMTASATVLLSSAEDISQKAKAGNKVTSELSKQSVTIKRDLANKIQESSSIMEATKKELNIALENSKEVDKINKLTEAILQIANETNLLALNASIEAARAGDAGRGFAVVAEQIKKLSEDSKVTVAQIQGVTNVVINSVNDLANSSLALMKFMSMDVTNNYQLMLETADEYNTGSQSIDEIVSDFAQTAEILQTSIQGMLDIIDAISIATNEGASGTTNIAQNTSQAALNSRELLEQADRSKEYSENLFNLVSKFKL